MIFAIHGYLGSASDWNEIVKLTSPKKWITPSLFEEFKWPRPIEFKSVVNELRDSYYSTHANTFVGYSLGGRLGMHWLEMYPDDFQRWYFVSTNPGLDLQSEKETRYKVDEEWAAKIRQLDQQNFLDQWNGQSVFSDSKHNHATKINWNKETLSSVLLNLSLARQKDFSDILNRHKDKVHWIVGANDQKFLNRALKLKEGKKILHLYSLLGGHRIHLDQPKPLADLLNQHLG